MKNQFEIPYWMALYHSTKWKNEKINRLIVQIIHEKKINISDFFNLSEIQWKNEFNLEPPDCQKLHNIKIELPNYSFLAEELFSQGFEVITLDSQLYSSSLKSNLKTKYSPAILYVKGNTKILNENSIAIVGSRNASDLALQFTDNIAKNASKNYKVIVSGFAKGVDKQALDSSITYSGQSIIVLPQGVLTFQQGFKQYHQFISEGDVLVLSIFFPRAPWSVQLAMARNTIIYGLAKEIYVSESNEKGGTWSGVIDGLRKGRNVFVRIPNPDEKNANMLLIEKGAIPIDFNGNIIKDITSIDNEMKKCLGHEDNKNHSIENSIIKVEKDGFSAEIGKEHRDRIIQALKLKEFSSNELIKKCRLNISSKKLSILLRGMENIIVTKKSPMKFKYADIHSEPSLF